MFKLAPSILAADFARLGDAVELIDEAGCEYIHIDVMDGHFVPNLSFGIPVIKSIRSYTDKVFDVHLMIQNPDSFLEAYKDAGADMITVHAEVCTHLQRTLSSIRAMGLKSSVALNPATPLCVLDYVLEDVDMVLLMTVNPGFGGQALISNVLKKINSLREIINKRGLSCDIEVDGGINLITARQVIEAGANVLVAGSDIFKAEDAVSQVKEYKRIFTEYRSWL